jgi:hypothetical protein
MRGISWASFPRRSLRSCSIEALGTIVTLRAGPTGVTSPLHSRCPGQGFVSDNKGGFVYADVAAIVDSRMEMDRRQYDELVDRYNRLVEKHNALLAVTRNFGYRASAADQQRAHDLPTNAKIYTAAGHHHSISRLHAPSCSLRSLNSRFVRAFWGAMHLGQQCLMAQLQPRCFQRHLGHECVWKWQARLSGVACLGSKCAPLTVPNFVPVAVCFPLHLHVQRGEKHA